MGLIRVGSPTPDIGELNLSILVGNFVQRAPYQPPHADFALFNELSNFTSPSLFFQRWASPPERFNPGIASMAVWVSELDDQKGNPIMRQKDSTPILNRTRGGGEVKIHPME